MTGNIQTITGRDGIKRLAKVTRSGQLNIVTYANYAQAKNRRTALVSIGVNAEVIGCIRPYVIRIND